MPHVTLGIAVPVRAKTTVRQVRFATAVRAVHLPILRPIMPALVQPRPIPATAARHITVTAAIQTKNVPARPAWQKPVLMVGIWIHAVQAVPAV